MIDSENGSVPSFDALEAQIDKLAQGDITRTGRRELVERLPESVTLARWLLARNRELHEGITKIQTARNEMVLANRLLAHAVVLQFGEGHTVSRLTIHDPYWRIFHRGLTQMSGTLEECLAELRKRGVEV